MKKASAIICLLFTVIFSCAFTFPDRMPDWKNIKLYRTDKLSFQHTKLAEFQKKYPQAKVFTYDKNVKIISATPGKSNLFKKINIGFKDGVLDWLEFELGKPITMKEILKIYGEPDTIDTNYSRELDYYNFGKFNISTDKKHFIAKSISIFEIVAPARTVEKNPVQLNRTFFGVFPELKPGLSTEQDFNKAFPALLPYTEENNDTSTTYTMTQELGSAKFLYKKAVLRFENGLLAWISLSPVNTSLKAFTARITDPYKVEKAGVSSDFYVYKNIVLVVDRDKKTIIRIGVINYDKRI